MASKLWPAYRKAADHGRQESMREWIAAYKTQRGCQHCGITDHRVLAFHHRDPATKAFNIGRTSNSNFERFLAEIAKCDVLCMNCHTLLHYEERLATMSTPKPAPLIAYPEKRKLRKRRIYTEAA